MRGPRPQGQVPKPANLYDLNFAANANGREDVDIGLSGDANGATEAR